METPHDVKAFLRQHEGLFETLENGKIRCALTGHELPPRLDALTAHTNGKRFQKASQATNLNIPAQFREFLVPHSKDPGKMYCLLTRRSINRRQDEVMRHLGGVRFFKRYDDHMRKAELGTNGVGEQHETRVDEAEDMHVDDAVPDGDDELWVPAEYTKLERKSKSTKMEGESSMSESEAEASDVGDDMEVEAVIRTVLVKAPRCAWKAGRRTTRHEDDSEGASGMDVTDDSEAEMARAPATHAQKRKPEHALKSKERSRTTKRNK